MIFPTLWLCSRLVPSLPGTHIRVTMQRSRLDSQGLPIPWDESRIKQSSP